MKKLVFMFVAAMAFGLVSCDRSCNDNTSSNDSIADSVNLVDSAEMTATGSDSLH